MRINELFSPENRTARLLDGRAGWHDKYQYMLLIRIISADQKYLTK